MRDKLDLPDDADRLKCALARNISALYSLPTLVCYNIDVKYKYAKDAIKQQLLAEISRTWNDSLDAKLKIEDSNRLKNIPVFTVSAKNFLQIIGKTHESRLPVFTGILFPQ